MMKKAFKSVGGVTLLEIMLVLAIASMIIVMSIRYYQSASNSQKLSQAVNDITGIIAAQESFFNATGALGAASSIQAYLPGNVVPTAPWGGSYTVATTASNIWTIAIPNVPTGSTCTSLTSMLQRNSKLSVSASCDKVTITE